MTGSPITVDQLEATHWLVVGTTGSGKTYLARGLLAELRRADRRVGAVDKLGKLWGLTLAADGQRPGLEFVIFGGKRPGAIPMTSDQGAQLGRIFVERNVPAIFDLSQWKASDQERWVADFATAVFETNETALHLLFDEAQSWVPQGGGGPAYEAVRLLAEQGRGNGINLLLTAPRLSGLDANVRGAIAAMVAMRQTSDVDSKRTADLVSGHLKIDRKAFQDELPTLPTGTGFVWSPTGAGLDRVAFPANDTFDSSRTPRHGDTPPAPIAVSSALVDELRRALAKPADPESQKTGKPESQQAPADPDDRDSAAAYAAQYADVSGDLMRAQARIATLESELCGLRHDRETLDLVSTRTLQIGGDIGRLLAELLDLFDDERDAAQSVPEHTNMHQHDAISQDEETGGAAAGSQGAGSSPPTADRRERADAGAARKVPSDHPAADRELNGIAEAILENLRKIAPARLTWRQAAQMANRSPLSGPFYSAKKQLVEAGAVTTNQNQVWSSGDHGTGISRKEALAIWSKVVDGFAPRMIAVLADGSLRSRTDLGATMGVSTQSGPWYGGLKQLRERGLIEEFGSDLRLVDPIPGERPIPDAAEA